MNSKRGGMSRRLRLITMAWGEGYIRQLFDFALPAVLAPGNLPALTEQFDCEMVIVTSENWFDELRRHPVYRRIARHCPIELRPVDEFVNRPDAYGMALTYALFRGFEDLGARMLDTYLVFFNADFIMADGSLRSVARKIAEGERMILSPSYCVVLEDVVPQLASRRTPETGVLAIPPRDMAALALRHRHNTIRGKTVNQRLFSMEWIDQFYWLVDERTLIAHQLPIAVVCMRPTRMLTEMRTFWDYGIISEACPAVDPCVLADSDDFLMIELRKGETAREQISLGWPTPRQVAEKLEKFITSDPVSLARYTLVLHSGDLPADLGRAKEELDAYVESVLRELPDKLTDHVNHPIWAYHYPRFQQARREYLIKCGSLEEPPGPPEPADPAPTDVEPSVTQASTDVEPSAPQAPIGALRPRRSLPVNLAFAAYRRVFGLAPNVRPWHPRWSDVQPVLRAVAAVPDARILVVSSEQLQERLLRNLTAEHAVVRDILPANELDNRHRDEQSAGTRLFRINIDHDLPAMVATSPDSEPHAVRLRSLQVVWQDAEEMVAGETATEQADAGTEAAICSAGDPQTAVPEAFAFTEPNSGQTGRPAASVPPPADEPAVTEEFDLCLCEVNADDLMHLRTLIRSLAPRLRRGGSILVLHLNHSLAALSNAQALILNNTLALDLPCRFHFAGSESAAQALLGFAAAVDNLRSRRPAAMARATLQLGRSVRRAWRASRIRPLEGGRPPDFMTSLVVEVSVTRHVAAVSAASAEEPLKPAR